jgi:hypothetical protein
LTACGTTGPAGAPTPIATGVTPSPTADAREVIELAAEASRAAARHTTEQRRFGQNMLTVTADLGVRPLRIRYEWAQPKQPAFVAIGDDFYFRKDAKATRPWLHLKRSKLPQRNNLTDLVASRSSLAMLYGIVDAEASSANTYRGRVDLQLAANATTDKDDQALIDLVIDTSGNLIVGTFELTIEEGRITSLRIDVGLATLDQQIGYGPGLLVTAPPAAKVRQATADDYIGWNG